MPIEDRSQYLSFAGLCQTLVDSLLSYVEEGNWQKLAGSLEAIIEPLEAVSTRPVPTAGGQSPAFAGYEQRRTVAQVWTTEEDRRAVVNTLKNLQRTGDAPESKKEARALIKPFQQLANQALWNFEQPTESLPRGVLKLCKAT